MLRELRARDLALIEDAWMEFGPGMTVLSGETGAGKTVLVGALKLLLGERADSGAVRSGAGRAIVEGVFEATGTELVVARRVGVDGRSRCQIDGDLVTVGALADRVGPLVDLHGQHEHQALLASSTHVGYLDRWIGPSAASALEAYRDARVRHGEAVDAVAELERRVEQANREAEHLRFVVAEIGRVDPRRGEDAEIDARLPALAHAERLSAAASEVVAALRADGAALDSVSEAVAALARVEGIDPALDEMGKRLAEIHTLVDDVGAAARVYRDAVEHDPGAIDRLEARRRELVGLMRRFGPTLDDVLTVRDEAEAALACAESGDVALTGARAAAAASRERLEHAALVLTRLRAEAAPAFCESLASAARDLAMGGTRFEVAFTDLEFESWTADGSERVEFLYAAAAAQPARPLARIASGGELSRVMLALKSVFGSADEVATLIFDEVDAGIGGATASAVGRRLSELSRTHQVIVVTHLAQVAAFADAHFVVRKLLSGDSATTTVVPVEGDDRIAELARMLSGTVTETSRAHALELVSSAEAGVRSA